MIITQRCDVMVCRLGDLWPRYSWSKLWVYYWIKAEKVGFLVIVCSCCGTCLNGLALIYKHFSPKVKVNYLLHSLYTEKSGAKMAPHGKVLEKQFHFFKVEPFFLNNRVLGKKRCLWPKSTGGDIWLHRGAVSLTKKKGKKRFYHIKSGAVWKWSLIFWEGTILAPA